MRDEHLITGYRSVTGFVGRTGNGDRKSAGRMHGAALASVAPGKRLFARRGSLDDAASCRSGRHPRHEWRLGNALWPLPAQPDVVPTSRAVMA